LHECLKGVGEGVRGRGGDGREKGFFGDVQKRRGGGCPDSGFGEARGLDVGGVDAAEGGGEGAAQGAHDARGQGVELALEVGFGAGCLRGLEDDGQGAGGEVGWEAKGTVGGEQDGAAEGDGEGVAVARFVEPAAHAGGEAAEGGGEMGGNRGDMIEGQQVVLPGEFVQVALGVGERVEGGGGGIDEGAEEACGGGLAGAGGTAQDEDGVGAAGAERGE
jgi:hypothetical protein